MVTSLVSLFLRRKKIFINSAGYQFQPFSLTCAHSFTHTPLKCFLFSWSNFFVELWWIWCCPCPWASGMFYLWIWLSPVQCPSGIEIHKSIEGAGRSVILFHYLQLYKRGGSSHLIENKSPHNALWNSLLSSLNQTFSNIQRRAQRGGTSGAGIQHYLEA